MLCSRQWKKPPAVALGLRLEIGRSSDAPECKSLRLSHASSRKEGREHRDATDDERMEKSCALCPKKKKKKEKIDNVDSPPLYN